METDFQRIAKVRNTTGCTRVKLGLMEVVSDCVIMEDKILLSISRADVDFVRGSDLVIKRRGYTMWNFVLEGTVWRVVEPVTYWFEPTEPEVYKTYVVPAEEQLAKREWEEMCARPGTPQNPLDTPSRVAQIKETGY